MPSFFVGCVQGAELEESSQPEQPNPGKTHGELRFEEYLRNAGVAALEFERNFPGSSRTPDYSFQHNGDWVLLDVKDFADSPRISSKAFLRMTLTSRYAESSNEGRRKFKKLKDYLCGLVLYNHDKPFTVRPLFVYGRCLAISPGRSPWTPPLVRGI
jgi:hypothetical protein